MVFWRLFLFLMFTYHHSSIEITIFRSLILKVCVRDDNFLYLIFSFSFFHLRNWLLPSNNFFWLIIRIFFSSFETVTHLNATCWKVGLYKIIAKRNAAIQFIRFNTRFKFQKKKKKKNWLRKINWIIIWSLHNNSIKPNSLHNTFIKASFLYIVGTLKLSSPPVEIAAKEPTGELNKAYHRCIYKQVEHLQWSSICENRTTGDISK